MPTTDLAKTWGKRLAEHRRVASLTQQALADQVGVTRAHVAKIEGGVHTPSDALRIRLAAVLSTTVSGLFPYDEAA